MPDLEVIRSALRRVVDPCSIASGHPIDLIDMGLVEEIREDHGAIEILLRLTSPICWQASNIIAKVQERSLRHVSGRRSRRRAANSASLT